MKKYIKKPVSIEALQWTGKNINEIMGFMNWRNADHNERNGLTIYTLEGSLHASVGDFIIKGIKGEYYPCEPFIFKATYFTEEEYDKLAS